MYSTIKTTIVIAEIFFKQRIAGFTLSWYIYELRHLYLITYNQIAIKNTKKYIWYYFVKYNTLQCIENAFLFCAFTSSTESEMVLGVETLWDAVVE